MVDLDRLKEGVRGKKLIVFGPPGSGKGNRSNDFKALGLVAISAGIVLRNRLRDEPNSDLSKKVAYHMKKGELVPSDIIVPIILGSLEQRDVLERGFVLDGFPRTRDQGKVLFSRIDPDLVLFLDVPRSFLTYGVIEGNRRVCPTCQKGYSDFDPPKEEGLCDICRSRLVKRLDDDASIIEKRLKDYDKQVKELLPLLESTGKFQKLSITVDKDEEIDERLLKKIKGEAYWVETDDGGKARMLNLEGMRMRLYNLIWEIFVGS
ncbi:adenylate kinase [archaeon BMS3Bbin16]|nr:adenylate kinase [archaeon BMS3Bbin16]